VCGETREDAHRVCIILTEWLAERGVTLSEDKTRIVHRTEGVDFLGFTSRRYTAPRTRTGSKRLITPSADSVKRLRTRLRAEWQARAGQPIGAIVKRLTPLIRGWANYFRISVATKTFRRLDHWMVTRELR
jgi:RNA-directed DNA polymerase